MEKEYDKLIGKRYFGWEIIKTYPNKEEVLCIRVEENDNTKSKIGTKALFSIQYFILRYLNNQSSKHKTLPNELFQLLK